MICGHLSTSIWQHDTQINGTVFTSKTNIISFIHELCSPYDVVCILYEYIRSETHYLKYIIIIIIIIK